MRGRLKRRWMTHDGLEVSYHQEGAGPDLLLLPSQFILATTYRPTIGELSSRFRVTVVEMPGCGRSARLQRPWSFGQSADFMRGVSGALGLDRPCVVGHSNSGPVAALLVASFPEAFRAAVLADSIGAHPSQR